MFEITKKKKKTMCCRTKMRQQFGNGFCNASLYQQHLQSNIAQTPTMCGTFITNAKIYTFGQCGCGNVIVHDFPCTVLCV